MQAQFWFLSFRFQKNRGLNLTRQWAPIAAASIFAIAISVGTPAWGLAEGGVNQPVEGIRWSEVSEGIGLAPTVAPELSSLSCAKGTITGTGTDSCTVTLTEAASSGGLKISLNSSDTEHISVPAAVTVAADETTATFTATVAAAYTTHNVTVTAAYNGISKTYTVDLIAPALSGFSCTKGTITGAGSDSCTVTLTAGAPSDGLDIALKSSDGTHIPVPGGVTVAKGATTAKFTATVAAAYTTHTVTLTASDGGVSKTYAIDLVAPGLSSLSCTKGTINGAGTDSCTVTLTAGAPSDGLDVTLKSSDGAHIPVPGGVIVAEGATSATFTATVAAAAVTHTVTLTADYNGVSKTYAIDLVPPALSSLSCAKGTLTTVGTDSCTVTLTGGASNGMVVGLNSSDSKHITVPASVSISPGATTATFTATVIAEASTTHTATLTASDAGVSKTYAIDLVAPQLSVLSCTSATITGAGSDTCTVTLTAAAPSGGLDVDLVSSDVAHIPVPGSVLVANGATSATFTATIAAAAATHTVTLTASEGGVSKTYAIDLLVSSPGLTLGSTSVAFGDVTLNKPATQSVLLTSSGSAPLTISLGKVTGTGFSLPGVTFPITLNPGASMELDLEFDPSATGSSSGLATFTTNTSTGSATIALTGTGVTAAYVVNLAWDAPTGSSDPVAGYDIYRAVSGSSSYELLNSGLIGSTSYGDTTVQSGTTYIYYVVSVDASGNQSAPSNEFTAVVP